MNEIKNVICLLPKSPVATWVRLQIPVVSPPGLGGRSLSSLQTYFGLGLDSNSRMYGHRPLLGPEDTSKESHFWHQIVVAIFNLLSSVKR